MKQLTQEEAERCARAYDIELAADSTMAVRHLGLGKVAHLTGSIPPPTDPYFWFGRLWNKAGELAWDGHGKILIVSAGPICIVHASSYKSPTAILHEKIAENEYPCPALCEAIEKLKEK